MSRSNLRPAIARKRPRPGCERPSVQPREPGWMALVVPAAIYRQGSLAETNHTIGGTSESFVWDRVQSAAGSLLRFVSSICSLKVAIPYHTRVAIVIGHSSG